MPANSLRIALLTEHANPLASRGGVDAGGENVYIEELSRELGAHGHRVDVVTRWQDPAAPLVTEFAPNVRVVQPQVGTPQWIFKDELWPLMPDFRDAFLRFASTALPYDVLHGNFWMSGWVSIEAARNLRVPVVQIFHAMGKTKRRHQGEADTSPDERIAVEHKVIEKADRLIAQCPSERDELVNDYGAPLEKIATIPSAVNTLLFSPQDRQPARRRAGLPAEGLIVGYIGRLLPRKDVRNVVRGVAVLKEQTGLTPMLLVVGGDTEQPDPERTPEIGELQRLAAELGVAEQIHFVGARQPEELACYYSACDVVVSTPWYEPFGLTPLEAMACGVPVVGSAVGGITFTVKDGETGLLVPPRDPEVLARALSTLLTDPRRRQEMGRRARKRVESEFTWSVVARRTSQLYREVLRESAANKEMVAAGGPV